MIVMVMHC